MSPTLATENVQQTMMSSLTDFVSLCAAVAVIQWKGACTRESSVDENRLFILWNRSWRSSARRVNDAGVKIQNWAPCCFGLTGSKRSAPVAVACANRWQHHNNTHTHTHVPSKDTYFVALVLPPRKKNGHRRRNFWGKILKGKKK